MGLFPLDQVMPELMEYLRTLLPADALSLLEKYLENVVKGSSGDILSLGLLGALWASSSGVTAIMEPSMSSMEPTRRGPIGKSD